MAIKTRGKPIEFNKIKIDIGGDIKRGINEILGGDSLLDMIANIREIGELRKESRVATQELKQEN